MTSTPDTATPMLAALTADAEQVADDDVAGRIVAAARELISEHGLTAVTMDAVAKSAGVGRATLYRRFASRDEVLRVLVASEVIDALGKVREVIRGLTDPGDRIVEAFALPVELARGNSLLRELLAHEPSTFVPALTLDVNPVFTVARANLIAQLTRARDRGALRPVDVEAVAEMLIRIAHSLVLSPGGPIDVDDPEALRDFARRHVAGPLLR